jgi:hypothetical protein
MENINEQFKRLFCELDLTDDQAAMIKKLQRDVNAALSQPHVVGRSEQLVCVHPYSEVYQSETECYCEKCGKDLTEEN